MPLLSNVYNSQGDMERRYSADAVKDFADHDADDVADTNVIEDSINQAKLELDLFLTERYTEAVLVANNLVNRWSTTLAFYFLSSNRGNLPPESVEREFQRLTDPITGLLPAIASGSRDLPDAAQRADMVPVMSNINIDRRYEDRTVRANTRTSSFPGSILDRDIDSSQTSHG